MQPGTWLHGPPGARRCARRGNAQRLRCASGASQQAGTRAPRLDADRIRVEAHDRKAERLDIIISNASDKPIYEQIVVQMKDAILAGELEEGSQLPSIRNLASDLRISVITTKRAYAELEEQGFIETVQGKGSFVAGGNRELLREERLRHVESLLGQAAREAASAGVTVPELHEMLDLVADGGG